MQYEPVIGLEVHAQLKTETKIFCSCSTKFGAEPNQHTCPICLGMPGVLPVLNKKVVDFASKIAIATNCKIAKKSIFARKNYFYPDLPKGYQISQYDEPFAIGGYLEVELEEKKVKKIGITRIHLEEDAGKSSHDTNRNISMVDLNRTGVPLTEIVSEPDIRSAKEASAYLKQLRSIVRYLNICDGNMEEGSFRCDANISLREVGEKEFGTRTELKNLNSFKNVEKAINYEIERQKILLDSGKKVIQETRLWDADKNRTLSMRGKEDANDYRYFPDPDLLPITISEEYINDIKKDFPEMPLERKKRFTKEYNIPDYDAEVLTSSRDMADYFEECAKNIKDKKLVSNFVMVHILGFLNTSNKKIDECPVSSKSVNTILSLLEKDSISLKIAKSLFDEVAETGESPETIVKSKNLMQVNDTSEIEKIVKKVLSENPKEVEAYKNGKTKLMGFFVGQIMKETKGKANPKIVNDFIQKEMKL